METILRPLSGFLVSHLYKWILPAIASYLMFIEADANQNPIVRVVLWFFLIMAYLSIPINFEKPKKQFFEGYMKKKRLYFFIIILQVNVLGIMVFVITLLAIIWCIPILRVYSLALATMNALLYGATLLVAYSQLSGRLNV